MMKGRSVVGGAAQPALFPSICPWWSKPWGSFLFRSLPSGSPLFVVSLKPYTSFAITTAKESGDLRSFWFRRQQFKTGSGPGPFEGQQERGLPPLLSRGLR